MQLKVGIFSYGLNTEPMRKLILKVSILFYSAFGFAQDGFIPGKPALAYWIVGNKSEIIIALHGGPAAAHEYLRPEWDKLSEFAQLIYYDQRGCGKSKKAKCHTWREHVEDLKRVINFFAKGKKVILAGSSWGSILATLYSYSFPEDVKGIILSGTIAWRGKGNKKMPCVFYESQIQKNYPYWIEDEFNYRSLRYGYSLPSSIRKDSAKWSQVKNDKFFESHFLIARITMNSLEEAPTVQELNKIKTPVLIFETKGPCREQHLLDGTQQFVNIFSNLRIYTIEESCHDPWYTHPDIFFQQAMDFVDQLK